MHEKGHFPLDGKPIKDSFGFDQLQEFPRANGVDDTTVNDSPALPDESLSQTKTCLRARIL
jgi:hypothetical protein